MMKKWFILIVLLVAVVLLWIFQQPKTNKPVTVEGTPWQISVLPDGNSRVFGLILGKDTFVDAQLVLGIGYELAVISPMDGSAGLEMYYSRYRAGPITGKLVVVADVPPEQLDDLKQQASQVTTLQNGTKQYVFGEHTEEKIGTYKIKSLTFIPTINLDAELLQSRFGEPDEVIVDTVDSKQQHYIYSEKGLDIVLSEEGKEVMQYVAPKDFELLLKPKGVVSTPLTTEEK